MLVDVIAALSLVIWLHLLMLRGNFWLCRERDDAVPAPPARWPRVTAVVPARNEAECIPETVAALMRQDYPGEFSVIVVDDDSEDGTAGLARQVADGRSPGFDLDVIRSCGVQPGWTGKLWALKQGIDAAQGKSAPPEYLLLTDADIVHAPDSLAALMARAEGGGYGLTSLMALLRCESFAERSHVPAFVYFFQMLFPFAWVNSPAKKTAAAAGGCMLVRTEALRQAGGIESIRSALIDDCSLAKRLKTVGPIWLGLTQRVRSIRRYEGLGDVRHMISRSAYAQLDYSPLLLAGTAVGMMLTFLAAPLLVLFGQGAARILGALVWALMALSFQPMLKYYRASPLWGVALPAIALAYMIYTLDSAVRYVRGQGGQWKGRVQAGASQS